MPENTVSNEKIISSEQPVSGEEALSKEKVTRAANRNYIIALLAVAAFAIAFVTWMGYLNYRSTAIRLEEKVIARVSEDTVENIETAVGFGKSFRNYYGIGDIFTALREQVAEGVRPFVIDSEGELLYYSDTEDDKDGARIREILRSREFARDFPAGKTDPESENLKIVSGSLHSILVPVHEDGNIIGYFGVMYTDGVFNNSFKALKIRLVIIAVLIMLLVFAALFGVARWMIQRYGGIEKAATRIKAVSIVVMAVGIMLLSAVDLYAYQSDYRVRLKSSVRSSLQNLETKIAHVSKQGVDLRDMADLRDYIEQRVRSLDMLHAVRISDRISEVKKTDEESDLITYMFTSGSSDEKMYLEAELSNEAVNREMRGIIVVLISTMIILLIFALELFNIVELLSAKTMSRMDGGGGSFSEKQVSLALRFTGFLCATAEYMCVPYAAMMIRESGESLFGLSVGMTAALPLTMESIAQMVGMLVLPRLTRRFNVRVMLIVSAVVMAACNFASFANGTALIIVLCRLIAGLAYAGFKQVSNFLITSGYETEAGRSENISQDNAGLLAGATCGAGLGAILSANAGYGTTFLFSSVLFVVYMLITLAVIPWKMLSDKSVNAEKKPIVLKNVLRMFLSPEMLLFILFIGIPLNIGVMLCVTLIPAICQSHGISSVMLSYCYIANGLAGIYLGPSLVTAAKIKYGLGKSIAFTFALTAAGIFILHIPPVVLMIVITSMILGFLDGFGTPLTTDKFMSLRVVRTEVDESTSLIFSVVLTYVLLTFAPIVAELLILPASGGFSPMMIAVLVYALAAVVVFFMKDSAKNR